MSKRNPSSEAPDGAGTPCADDAPVLAYAKKQEAHRRGWLPLLAFGGASVVVSALLDGVAVFALRQFTSYLGAYVFYLVEMFYTMAAILVAVGLVVAVLVLRRRHYSATRRLSCHMGLAGAAYAFMLCVPHAADVALHGNTVVDVRFGLLDESGVGLEISMVIWLIFPLAIGLWATWAPRRAEAAPREE